MQRLILQSHDDIQYQCIPCGSLTHALHCLIFNMANKFDCLYKIHIGVSRMKTKLEVKYMANKFDCLYKIHIGVSRKKTKLELKYN